MPISNPLALRQGDDSNDLRSHRAHKAFISLLGGSGDGAGEWHHCTVSHASNTKRSPYISITGLESYYDNH